MSGSSTEAGVFEVDRDRSPVAGSAPGQARRSVILTLIAVGAAVIGYLLYVSGTPDVPESTLALEAAPPVESQPPKLYTGPDGTGWAIANGGLWRFGGRAWAPIDAGEVTLQEMAFDVGGTLWVTDGHGVWRIVGEVLEEIVTSDGGRLVDSDQGTIVSILAHPQGGLVAQVAEWNIAQPEIWWIRGDRPIEEMSWPLEFDN